MKISNFHPALKLFCSYILAIVFALIFTFWFSKFYEKVFNPPAFRYGLFYDRNQELIIGGFIFAYILFLPLFVYLFINKKRILFWLIGILIPFLFLLRSGLKELMWFAIFTIAGFLLGWLIKFTHKKLKKS